MDAALEVVRDEMLELTAQVLEDACEKWSAFDHAPYPDIDFDLRGSVMAYARWYGRGGVYGVKWLRLSYNMDLVRQLDSKERFKLVAHEVAHLVATVTGLGKGHDKGWKRIVVALGGEAERCYSPSELGITITPARKTRRYIYEKDGVQVTVGPVHHKRVQTVKGYTLASPSLGLTKITAEHFIREAA